MSNAVSVIELDEDQLIAHACHVLEQRLKYRTDRAGCCLESPDAVRKLLRLRFSEREHEVFAVLFLDLCAAHSNVELDHKDRLVKRIRRCQLHINAVIAGASS